MAYADPKYDNPVQLQQPAGAPGSRTQTLALGNGATLGADAGSLIDLSGVPAGSTLVSVQEGLTALASGGASGATAVTAEIARFTTVANDHDSCILPVAKPGVELTIINAGSHILDIYPNQTLPDTINALTAGNPLSISATKVVMLYCTLAGQWHSLLTA